MQAGPGRLSPWAQGRAPGWGHLVGGLGPGCPPPLPQSLPALSWLVNEALRRPEKGGGTWWLACTLPLLCAVAPGAAHQAGAGERRGQRVSREGSGKAGKATFPLLVSLERLHRVSETATRPAPPRPALTREETSPWACACPGPHSAPRGHSGAGLCRASMGPRSGSSLDAAGNLLRQVVSLLLTEFERDRDAG